MKIQAHSNLTEKSFKDIAMFRFSKGKKGVAAAVLLVWLLAFIAAVITLFQFWDGLSAAAVSLLFAVGVWFYYFLIFEPHREFLNESRAEQLQSEFTFCDGDFVVRKGNDLYTSIESLRYEGLSRVTEFDMYFILNVTPSRFYIVEKSGMTVENVKQLREKFLSEILPSRVFVKEN